MIFVPPDSWPKATKTFLGHGSYIYICILLVYIWPPQDLPKSCFNGIYSIKGMFSFTKIHYKISNTSKLQLSQDTEKHNIFADAFLKTSENHLFFVNFIYLYI